MAKTITAKNIRSLIPQRVQVSLKAPFLFLFRRDKTISLRHYSFRDKIFFMNKYGEEEFVARLNNITSKDFELTLFEIVYQLIPKRFIGPFELKEYRDFDDFLKYIVTIEDEAKILKAGLEALGIATAPKLTEEELKEASEELKKK